MTALDTMALIWGIQESGNPKQANLREMQCRAAILIEMLDDDSEKICIPCISVSELLVKVDDKDHAAFVASLQKSFFCPSFDIRASVLAAKLYQQHKKLSPEEQTGRTTLGSDVKIIATAKIAGATAFYSNDKKCRKLATLAGMTARDLPTKHPDIYRDNEIKKRFGQPTD
ncbi:MAG TPA: PIN domain-containing protein [Gemmataceae bacterium]|jgi:predicted nucleic acid-binding protein|nr:PIN domain-containing protein [Gemmataceae bacterium]